MARLTEYATQEGFVVSRVVTEIGSGLNGHRDRLAHCLGNSEVKNILIEHRDRLTRFGFEWIQILMQSSGRKILVMDDTELKGDSDDLVRDMVDILTSFCARLYGKRSAAHRVKQAMSVIEGKRGNHDKN